MQLGAGKQIRNTVAALTAVMLGHSTASAADQGRLDASVLHYSETNRVSATEGLVDYRRPLGISFNFGLKLTYDGITGASPIGAIPSSRLQTFTRPSGRSTNTIQPGQFPLDASFHDNRVAVDAEISKLMGRLTTATLGTHVSFEHDYSSLGLSGGLTRDFNQKNTTVGISASYSHDVVTPVGGAHDPFSEMQPPVQKRVRGSGKSKQIADAMIGFSQILDQRTIFRMNYSIDHSSGYLTDPYKILSVVLPLDSVNAGDAAYYVYENRPNTRTKNAVFGQVLRHIGNATVDLSYRHFWDDWGIKSNTVESFVQFLTRKEIGIQPHFRWYHQSRADFYHPFLVEGPPFPAYASADSRLAKFDAFTYGMQFSFPIGHGNRFSIAAEYYYQNGEKSPPEAFGALLGFDLSPEMKTVMLRVGFSRGL